MEKEHVKKAGRAINAIKQLLRTTGNVSPKLGEILFESKIEPVLTYGSIIWAVENSTNNVVMHDIALYLDIENTRKSIYDFFKDLWKGYCPDLDQVRVLGKKGDVNRPVMVKFANLKDKEKLQNETVDLPPDVKVEDRCISSSCKEIEQVLNTVVTC